VKSLLLKLKLLEKLVKIGRKNVKPEGVLGEIMKFGRGSHEYFLARQPEIALENATIPSDGKKPLLFY